MKSHHLSKTCLKRITLVTIHHQNIHILATVTYKFLQGLSPPVMNEIFAERNNNYSLRGNNVLTRPTLNSVRYGIETVSFLAPNIWDILPNNIEDSESLDIFKRKTKNLTPWECPCKFCKTYVPLVGFICEVKIKGTYHLLS